MRPHRVLPIALAIPALAACGKTVIDGGKTEDLVRGAVTVPVARVTCPDGQPVRQGETFECQLELKDGSREAVIIEELDDTGKVRIIGSRQTRLSNDHANVRIKAANVEALIRASIPGSDRYRAQVVCPEDQPVRKGVTFTCRVRLPDATRAVVTIEEIDDLGNVRIAGSQQSGSTP
jgi:hypothetical protein